jgi:hypothetical protein
MTLEHLGQEFTIDQVSFTKKTDCFVNIQKRKELVQYRSASSSSNVNLSFVQSEDVNSSVNLTVNDRSTSLVANKVLTELADQILDDVAGFTIETDLFFVTDVFTVDLITQQRIPLFFQHNLSRVLSGGETYNDIRVVDQSFEDVLKSQYSVDSTDGIVYSNLENTFDPITGLSELFFVTYTVKKTNGVLERYTEILNNQPVFRLAELDDIDLGSGTILPGRKVYIVQEDIGDNFSVTLPVLTDYGLRRSSVSRIEVLLPEATTSEDPWFIRVRSGKFLSTGVTGIKKFYVAEFTSQSFVPYLPYKQTDETSYRVSSRIIKTLKNKIAISQSELLFPEVIVYRSDGTFKFALTSNPARLGDQTYATGTYFSNVLLGSSKVAGTGLNASTDPISGSSIDSYGGFIVLPAGYEVSETDTIRSIYTYSEDDYEFSLFDFNPLSSADLVNQRVALVLRPEPLGSTLTQTLYYLVVNEDGLVVDSDIDFDLAGLPDSVENLIAASGLWYDRNPSGVFWSQPGGVDFVNNCSVEGAANQDDILILGDVYTREAIRPNSLVLNDIRIRGGGIRESEIENSIALNPEAEWYWDMGIWDGKPYPGGASMFIDVPIELLSLTPSGELTPENISEIVRRHIALGTYPVVHAYNLYETLVSGLEYLPSGLIKLSWTPGPPDCVYNIYTSLSENGNFELLASGLSQTSFTTSGVADKHFAILGYPQGATSAFLGGSIFEAERVELE